jgi:hypothetical protein
LSQASLATAPSILGGTVETTWNRGGSGRCSWYTDGEASMAGATGDGGLDLACLSSSTAAGAGFKCGRCLWPRRDRKLEGEICGTQFRQVRAARCVIPYVMYVA